MANKTHNAIVRKHSNGVQYEFKCSCGEKGTVESVKDANRLWSAHKRNGSRDDNWGSLFEQ